MKLMKRITALVLCIGLALTAGPFAYTASADGSNADGGQGQGQGGE